MSPKKPQHKLPKHLKFGKTGKSQEAKTHQGLSPGKVMTNLPEINWTPSKLTLTIIALCIPYLIAVVGSILVGNYLVASVFVGLAVLVVGMYLLLRYIERSDL